MEKQLTPEELKEIQDLQEQIQEITLQLGSIELKKIQLKNLILSLQKKEEEIAVSLSNKYGKGSLDITTGKLTIVED